MTNYSADQQQDIYETPSGTPDFKTELAAQLSELIPEAIADGKVDVEKLKELLDDDAADSNERFGLFWAGKKRALRAAQEPTTATLKPDVENSKDWDTTKNVFIEGDNLEVLKILQKHYHGKIKMIYIDPPYNTGKDFVYPDNYKEGLETYLEWTRQVNEEGKKVSTNSESEGRYHSNWLNMMYPRLKLARNLLTEDGLIFLSISETEHAHLRKLCDEVFGEANFVADVVWQNREGGGGSDSRLFKVKHEYLLVYARRSDAAILYGEGIGNADRYTETDEWVETRGKHLLIRLESASLGYVASLDYPIVSPDGVAIHPNTDGRKVKRWRWSKKKVDWGMANGYVVFKRGGDGELAVYTKMYVNADNEGNIISRTKAPLAVVDEYSTTQSSKELQKLFGGKKFFDYPKPVAYVKWILERATAGDDLVLDFFAGSGTTAHAVLELNRDDGGMRRFIQIQLPEPVAGSSEAARAGFRTIADISRRRIALAGDAVTSQVTGQVVDVGFKAYTLTDTNFTKWQVASDADASKLEQHLLDLRDSADDDATSDALFTELLLKQGYSLTEKISDVEIDSLKLKSVGDGLVLAYLDEHTKPTLEQLRTVFGSEDLARFIILEDAFKGDDQLKTNLVQEAKTRGVELWTA